jgi:hypothetical protein
VNSVELKKYWGFILNFGYIEASYVSKIIIHHSGTGFDTLEEALTDLAHVFLDDYIEPFKTHSDPASYTHNFVKSVPTLEGFSRYLCDQPTRTASAGPSFLINSCNNESWWPWDSISVLYPYLDKFWENDDPIEVILPHYLNLANIIPEKFVYNYGYSIKPEWINAFKEEVIKLQTPPKDEWHLKLFKTIKSHKNFECIVRATKHD